MLCFISYKHICHTISCSNQLGTGYYIPAQCKTFICISSFNLQVNEVATIVTFILYRRKPRFREANGLAESHTVSKRQNKGLEPRSS